MKRILSLMLMMCCFLLNLPANAATKEIPHFCKPILEAWGVTDEKELMEALLKDREKRKSSALSALPKGSRKPVTIRLGGTTKELIKTHKKWDVAIVSSKEVDLQELADAGLIYLDNVPNPTSFFHLEQWLYPEAVQKKIPTDPFYHYCVYCYDYNSDTDEAFFIIWNRKGRPVRYGNHTARQLLEKRTPVQVRAVEGICRKIDWNHFGMPEMLFSEDELIEHSDEWDWAVVQIYKRDKLEKLDAAGLLYDFSQHEYWQQRNPDWELPSGIWNEEGEMIAIPYHDWNYDDGNQITAIVINAKSSVIPRALAYTEHYIKSFEWLIFGRLTHYSDPQAMKEIYDLKDFEIGWLCILKEDVDW